VSESDEFKSKSLSEVEGAGEANVGGGYGENGGGRGGGGEGREGGGEGGGEGEEGGGTGGATVESKPQRSAHTPFHGSVFNRQEAVQVEGTLRVQ
jgi:hypothetical protein